MWLLYWLQVAPTICTALAQESLWSCREHHATSIFKEGILGGGVSPSPNLSKTLNSCLLGLVTIPVRKSTVDWSWPPPLRSTGHSGCTWNTERKKLWLFQLLTGCSQDLLGWGYRRRALCISHNYLYGILHFRANWDWTKKQVSSLVTWSAKSSRNSHENPFWLQSHPWALFAALVAILLLPETATMEPWSSGSSLQVRLGWVFISSTVCLQVLVSISTEVSWVRNSPFLLVLASFQDCSGHFPLREGRMRGCPKQHCWFSGPDQKLCSFSRRQTRSTVPS